MSLLQDIIRFKREEVAVHRKNKTVKQLMQDITTQTRDFVQALCMPGLSIIAEIKYRSPSAGTLPDQRDPASRARTYETVGARALSVLTDQRFFGGSSAYVAAARANTNLPVLRKDFIIDEYQIYESRYLGADALLLIVRILNERELARFITIARELNMACLVETHDTNEVMTACRVSASCIGINNRNLDTLEVDIGQSFRMKSNIPKGVVTVAESGVKTREDMVKIEQAGFDGVLIGHALAFSPCIRDTMAILQGRTNDRTE